MVRAKDRSRCSTRRSAALVFLSWMIPVAQAQEHWAFVPLREVTPPRSSRGPIDAFIDSRLAQAGVRAAPPCDDSTWLRRVYLDLTGLPPTLAEQGAFEGDDSPGRHERVVDKLLSRPSYGERWGRHWLDVARFAETKGYERDETMPQSWRYRDWVVEAFNVDATYDEFLVHQIAGDLIDEPDSRSQAASMFLSVGPFDTIVQNTERAKYDQLDDVIATTSQAFLGLTLQCARCHDHKFEPVSQVDYYRFLAAFSSLQIPARERDVASAAERRAIEEANRSAERALRDVGVELDLFRQRVLEDGYAQGRLAEGRFPNGQKPRVRDQDRGSVIAALSKSPDSRDKNERTLLERQARQIRDDVRHLVEGSEAEVRYETLERRFQSARAAVRVLPKAWLFPDSGSPRPTRVLLRGEVGNHGEEVSFGLPDVLEPEATPRDSERRRRWLAEWMTKRGRGTVARVFVNRVWQYHFGRGFVPSANNLGVSGGRPTHPDLLEWLASDLVESGWQIKRLHKRIVLSDVYRRGSRSIPGGNADPENLLYSRWSVRRLEAEAIRDSMLAISGRLISRMEGPGVFPPIERKVNGASAGDNWKSSDEAEASRRSVYVFAKRAFQLPELASLDQPDPAVSCEQRNVSTTAVQSLLLLNSRFAWTQAQSFAKRLESLAPEDELSRIDMAFRLVLCREPSARERQKLLTFLETSREDAQAGSLGPWATLCLVLLNTNEFTYLD